MPRDHAPDPVAEIAELAGLLGDAVARAAARDGLGEDGAQHARHALAWQATYAEALAAMADWAGALSEAGRLGAVETLLLETAAGEYLAQAAGGIPMSQSEIARPAAAGIDLAALCAHPGFARLTDETAAAGRRHEIAAALARAPGEVLGHDGLDDEMGMIRDQFRRFARERIEPVAHGWHLSDALIPAGLIAEMAAMGVFGLTIPEEFGGAGMSKTAMCVVSEELSRGYIGVGSLGTRSEIAAELILGGGTEAQKARWLPLIAGGEVLPTAVFTEPDTGSDLGALRTRAVKTEHGWAITGAKTWITHAARAGLMTLLARTEPGSDDWRGLSMFLAEKTPGSDEDPFPDTGLSGSEIGVLGYRGMKEYELAFEGFAVGPDALLGGARGQGFKQLMRTFESARIQTAARAVGVGQRALDLALGYALSRRQFGRPIARFPRVADKLAMTAVELCVARQLTYRAAAARDAGRRCDLEAGMAKLLAARVAWAAADAGVQIHGGNGFATEYEISRVLCDARILSIFEGAAEIQADVIARRLIERAAA